ncbi:FliH/SctL family protein [Algihabitans albus]|uniref:FliH/SctL family protein n=1 Tax=Algihabitans albus TaxID=2164067 RepID=UPI000E5CF888|nr:FliH/SctL family protein [Algihabitans albus]
MAVVERFLFDTSFDAGSASASARRAAPESTSGPSIDTAAAAALKEAAVEEARAEGYQAGLAEGEAAGRKSGFEEGRAKGQEEARDAGAQEVASALTLIEHRLQTLIDQKAEATVEAESLALTVLRSALAKLYPVWAQRHGLTEIEALLGNCLARLSDEPRVVVRVADSLYDALDERLSDLARKSGFEGKFVLLSEPELPHGDLRVEWADGGAERDATGTATAITEILDRALGNDPASSHASDDTAVSPDENLEG